MTDTVVNILDYGNTLNRGALDVSTSVQQALNDIGGGASDGYVLFFPPGIYLYQVPVLITQNVQLQGAGIDKTQFVAAPGFSNWMLLFAPVTLPFIPGYTSPAYESRNMLGRANVAAAKVYNATGRMGMSAPLSGITTVIKDITFDGNGAAQLAGGCINALGSVNSIFEHCRFTRPYDAGLVLGQIDDATFGNGNNITHCIFDSGNVSNGNGQGMRMSGNNNNIISLCTFQNNGGAGGSSYHLNDNIGQNIVEGCTFTGGTEAVRVNGGNRARIVNNIFQNVGKAIAHLQGTFNVCILGNIIYHCSSSASSNIEIFGGSMYTIIEGNNFIGTATNGGLRSFVREDSAAGTDRTQLSTNAFIVNGTLGQTPLELTGANSVAVNSQGYNPVGNIAAPAMPASTVAYTNILHTHCTVSISGGTVTAISIGGVATGLTGGNFRVPVGQTIAITYSVAPTWVWYGD